LEETSALLENGLRAAAEKANVNVQLTRVGSMLGLLFNDEAVDDYSKVKASDTTAYKVLFNFMLERGIYLPPSPFETTFVSAAHTRRDIERTAQIAAVAFERLVKLRSVEAGIESSVH